jgi:hypothetical protein
MGTQMVALDATLESRRIPAINHCLLGQGRARFEELASGR